MAAVVFAPYVILGETSVIPIHDQLDESLMTYVLNAKHLTDGTHTGEISELLGGINASGMQPAAVLFVPLYAMMPALAAFLVQYLAVFLGGFLGMYLSVKALTESSILAVVTAGIFCMLPIPPVYGLSVWGVPLLLWSFLCLYHRRRILVSFAVIMIFGLSTHLVYTGYVVLSFWALAILLMLFQGKRNHWIGIGFGWLAAIYVVVNRSLFVELFLGRGAYVSHREEMVNGAMPFWSTTWDVFWNSAQHAPSCHKALALPIALMLLIGGVLYKKMEAPVKKRYRAALAGMLVLVGIALFYGLCKSQPVTDWKNSCSGLVHYFQMQRFYWLYPVGWYLEFALCFALWWDGRRKLVLKLVVFAAVLYPTWQEIKEDSYLYMSVNQINNGSAITGYISWESFYAEDLMLELEEAIGRDISSYRVAHLGISPAPALMHGFYTADGYSNNYPLEYKHRFRKVIEDELAKSPETAVYFDTWGSRCYLFNATSGTAWMLGKGSGVVYEDLEFDTEALKALDCDYLFSCGSIENAEELGLECMGYFETEDSYWGIWLYRL